MADVASASTSERNYWTLIDTLIDGDDDVSATPLDLTGEYGALPRAISLQVVRTAGGTALISLFLTGSNDGTNFGDLLETTGSDGEIVRYEGPACLHYATRTETVGAGNTLTATIVLIK